MIRTLQKKFVFTAMAAITVLILFLLGVINGANFVIVGNQIDRTLQVVAEHADGEGEQPPTPDDRAPRPFMDAPKNEYDTFLSSNFFVVRFDQSGTIVYTDVSRTSAVTEEEAQSMASQIYASGRDSGRTGRFRYLAGKSRVGQGDILVFLDTSGENLSYIRVLLLSGAAGLVCWGLMLVLVMALSRRAIRPIVENMEKQKQFVTNAGHEIKTPLAIIQSNTEAMELYNGETKWSRNIKDQTVRLSGLMADLLALARMDEGAGQTNPTDLDLTGLSEEAIRSFAQPLEARGLAIQADIQPEVRLRADRAQLEQLLSILLDNAVKYADEGGTVWISLRREERRVRLIVQNTCRALPDAPPEKLFDRFYRSDTARTQKSGGYGIGLAVARSIVSANRGTLRAEYLPPDRIRFVAQF